MTDEIDFSNIEIDLSDININTGSGVDTITLDSGYPNMIGGTGGGSMMSGAGSSITAPYTVSTAVPNVTLGYGAGTGVNWVNGNHHPSIKVTGDADFDGDIRMQGQSLGKLLSRIEDRLAILMDPDPSRLEKFQALKKAYDNYKLMDKLCQEPPEEEE